MDSWSRVQIFHTGDDYFESLMNDLRHAKKSITIEGYIFAIDRLTQELLKELERARQRGCSVKLIVDGFGSYNYIPELTKICNSSGFEMRVFHPMPYFSSLARKWPRYRDFRFTSFLSRMNRRNHRKIVIIDEQVAYLGSLNFIEVHHSKYVGSKAWRDTGVRVEGSAIKKLVIASQITYLRTVYRGILTWVGRWRIPHSSFSTALQLNTTQKMRRTLYRDLLRLLSKADSRIYITTAYFLPKRSLLKVLLKAAERGVDVKLILPGKSDVPLVKWAAFSLVRFLLHSRMPIFEYQKTILHAKTMIVDNSVYIGSFNLNHRSLLHDLEVIARFQDSESLTNMLTQWETDLQNSRPVSEADFNSSWFSRWFYKIAFRLRYML
ncbi:phospholipase D-like domain-containing protein [Bdellovibrio svalbardensis]|uniref:Phosphatidylserine/phosphatidylglycerophosphate/ cardiolipin synthase family protein n=1 Tax=Bdellovibrio svalbardensis TaxID=2972972 RepID=A0ABT6DH46_9BACT|nr:phosphatidylserine/phosphatidylglycerophosphate/cardiolipin synthase family protein [Bdellovibrio svalbardensis]MDG0816165.1 phosphatidylserine/phosphatidylglycerophosphate/cardiolipin synthase family protein [Bdellovibrio svalbardensis]